jgi:hypothetical protein
MFKEYFEKRPVIEPLPFSEISFKTIRLDGKTFFNGLKLSRTPGVVVTYYYYMGKPFLRIGKAKHCMHSSASRVYETLFNRKVEDAQFAFIPISSDQIDLFVKKIKFGYLEKVITNTYDLLRPWINMGQENIPPTNIFNFRVPFFKNKWNFWDYDERPGVYLIEEDGVVVYVGFASNVGNRPRSHFYPTVSDRPGRHKRLEYWRYMNERSYRVAMVDCSPKEFSTPMEYIEALSKLEKLLIRSFKPRDNERNKPKEEGGEVVIEQWVSSIPNTEPNPF